MSNPLCDYVGADTTAAIGSRDDGGWFSRCHCGVVAIESGTYDECVEALNTHRDAP